MPQKETIVFQPSIFRCKLAGFVSGRVLLSYHDPFFSTQKKNTRYFTRGGVVLLGRVETPQIVQVSNPSFDFEKIKSGVAII